MSELDDIRKRLQDVETRLSAMSGAHAEGRRAADLFAMVDRDVADLSSAFTAQRQTLQALRDDASSQGRELSAHGQALDGIIATLQVIHDTQIKQARMLGDQGRILARLDPGGP